MVMTLLGVLIYYIDYIITLLSVVFWESVLQIQYNNNIIVHALAEIQQTYLII